MQSGRSRYLSGDSQNASAHSRRALPRKWRCEPDQGRHRGVLQRVQQLGPILAKDGLKCREGRREVDPGQERRHWEDVGAFLEGGDRHPVKREDDDEPDRQEAPAPCGTLECGAVSGELHHAPRVGQDKRGQKGGDEQQRKRERSGIAKVEVYDPDSIGVERKRLGRDTRPSVGQRPR